MIVGSCWQPKTWLLAAKNMVVGSQKHGCWQPKTWLLAVVGSQKHGCWQPKTWLLAAKNMVVGSCWQPKTWLLAAQSHVGAVPKSICLTKKMLPNTFFFNQQKNGAVNSFFALAFFDVMVDQWD